MHQETRASVEKRYIKLLIELVYFWNNRLRWQPGAALLDQRIYAFDPSGDGGDRPIDIALNLGLRLVKGVSVFIVLRVSRFSSGCHNWVSATAQQTLE